VAGAPQIKPVFLSASIPDPKRDPKYMQSADLIAIREAVLALAAVVLPHALLVFGGHPAISPFVRLVAERVHGEKNVRIYQSDFFRNLIPPDSQAFPDLVWTPVELGPQGAPDRARSLLRMREEMICCVHFGTGVFIGGMEGVEEEFDLFVRLQPTARLLPIASTGAASRFLFERHRARLPADVQDALEQEVAYQAMFRALLE
jgi:hypothetical protein